MRLRHGSGSGGSRLLSPVGTVLPNRVTPFSYKEGGEEDDGFSDHPREEAGLSGSWGTPMRRRCATSGCRSYSTTGSRVLGLSPLGVTGSSSRSPGSSLSPTCSVAPPTAIGHVRYCTAAAHPCSVGHSATNARTEGAGVGERGDPRHRLAAAPVLIPVPCCCKAEKKRGGERGMTALEKDPGMEHQQICHASSCEERFRRCV